MMGVVFGTWEVDKINEKSKFSFADEIIKVREVL